MDLHLSHTTAEFTEDIIRSLGGYPPANEFHMPALWAVPWFFQRALVDEGYELFEDNNLHGDFHSRQVGLVNDFLSVVVVTSVDDPHGDYFMVR